MSLVDIDKHPPPTSAPRTFPILEDIWESLDDENRAVLLRWLYEHVPETRRTRAAETISADLAKAGYRVSPSSINNARRYEWKKDQA